MLHPDTCYIPKTASTVVHEGNDLIAYEMPVSPHFTFFMQGGSVWSCYF